MPAAADEREQELAWEEWALSRRLRKQKRGRMIIACVFAVLITLVSATGALLSPKPSPIAPTNQSTIFTSAFAIESPALGPDGSHIVFSSNASGSFEIWEITVQGRQLMRLTYLQGDSLFPQFSPDGGSIAFYHVLGDSKEIMVMNSDGAGVRVLAQSVADGAFAWSPDGKYMAYDALNGSQNQVKVMNVANGNVIFSTGGSTPAWGRDSRSLVLVAQSNNTASVLAIANMTESYSHLVNVTGTVMYPRFYENSSSIVFLSFLDGVWDIRVARVIMNITALALISNIDVLSVAPGEQLQQTVAPEIGPESAPVVNATGNPVLFGASAGQKGECLFTVNPFLVYIWQPVRPGKTVYSVVSPLTPCNYVSIGDPFWGSAGRQIVFSARDATGMYDIVLIAYVMTTPTPSYG